MMFSPWRILAHQPKGKSNMSLNLITSQGSNQKLAKGMAKLGILNFGLNLLPALLGGFSTVCRNATRGCMALCIHYTGVPMMMQTKNKGRKRRTDLYFENRSLFHELLTKDIIKLIKKAGKNMLVLRLNMTSDLRSLTLVYAAKFKVHSNVWFVEYTKMPITQIFVNFINKLGNVWITFSRSETNDKECFKSIDLGVNVAVVLGGLKYKMILDKKSGKRKRKDDPMIRWFRGRKVIDGDVTDLRHLDGKSDDGKGLYVGLRGKGQARMEHRWNRSGFVVWGMDKWRRQIVHGPQTLTSWERSA